MRRRSVDRRPSRAANKPPPKPAAASGEAGRPWRRAPVHPRVASPSRRESFLPLAKSCRPDASRSPTARASPRRPVQLCTVASLSLRLPPCFVHLVPTRSSPVTRRWQVAAGRSASGVVDATVVLCADSYPHSKN